MLQIVHAQAQTKSKQNTRLLGAGLMASASVGLSLVASFGLSTWAELAPLHHAVQHVLLFGGGVGLGSSVLISRGGRRAR